MVNSVQSSTEILAAFAANLRFDTIPDAVLSRAEDLFVDWIGSALAGRGVAPVEAMAKFARDMGPADGSAEVLIHGTTTSPVFAALVNGASSHVAEQDDVHNGSVFHPAAVVFPPALAVAQTIGASGREFMTASVAGYEVGIRVGEFLGRSHYKIFHTTGTAGTLAAAAAVGRLLKLETEEMVDAFGSAGTQAAGLWEFLRDGADSKPLHTGKAAANGLIAAYLSKDGFTGAKQILEGPQGMAAGMSSDSDVSRLVDGLGERWALSETSFKFHASCRHTHPAADALLKAIQDNRLEVSSIDRVQTLVHQGAIDVLGPVKNPKSVHQAKFSMGTTLGLIANYGSAGMMEFHHCYQSPEVVAFRERVVMELDPEVDGAYPQQWIGKVLVITKDGQTFSARVDEPKGDPGNSLTRDEIESKVIRLAEFSGASTAETMREALPSLWNITLKNRIEHVSPKPQSRP